VGGDFSRIAILDNFCWGNTDRPEVLGTLVEAARGCHDAAVALRTPFISGKDSLRNEFRVGDRVISIPPSLLVSSISVADDVARLVTMDLKAPGNHLVLVGETREELGGSHLFKLLGIAGGEVPGLLLDRAPATHRAVARIIAEGLALSCHDLSEGGLAVAAAEMAFAGGVGAELRLDRVPRTKPGAAGERSVGGREEASGLERDEVLLYSESNARYLLEVSPECLSGVLAHLDGLEAAVVGETVRYRILRVLGLRGEVVLAEPLGDLRESWKSPLSFRE
jgi:phosphoribosylformylglycinamidine synthase